MIETIYGNCTIIIFFLIDTAFVRNPASLPEYDKYFLQALPITMYFDTTASNPTRVAEQVRRFYFDDQPITMSLFRNFTDVSFGTDFFIHSFFN